MKVKRTINNAVNLRLNAALKKLDGKVGKVGYLKQKSYQNGPTIAYVATIQEFGYPEGGTPPRPFMRPTIRKNKSKWRTIAKSATAGILKGTGSITTVLETIGIQAASDIRTTISKLQSPKLAQSTVDARTRATREYQAAKKGGKARKRMLETNRGNPTFIKPLVRPGSGQLLNSVTNSVENA